VSSELFADGKPFHGSETVQAGRLKGRTDTDYFYFFCPNCKDTTVLQILDYTVREDGPVLHNKEQRKLARRDFSIAFELHCRECNMHDFVKISSILRWGGKLKHSPAFRAARLMARQRKQTGARLQNG
jgi:ribosomal protein L44E